MPWEPFPHTPEGLCKGPSASLPPSFMEAALQFPISIFLWYRDLNPGPHACQVSALPLEPHPKPPLALAVTPVQQKQAVLRCPCWGGVRGLSGAELLPPPSSMEPE